MTIKEKLLEEFEAAINSVFGDEAEEEYVYVSKEDIDSIARKVKFYIGD